MKNSFFIPKLLIIPLFAILLVNSCTKTEYVEPQVNISYTTTTMNDTKSMNKFCGKELYFDFISTRGDNLGQIIIQNTADSLYVTYKLESKYMIQSIFMYAGEISRLPTNNNGSPAIQYFPVQQTLKPMSNTITVVLPLESLDLCYSLSAGARIFVLDQNGVYVDKMLATISGSYINQSVSFLQFVDACIQECDECVIEDKYYDIIADKTILAGKLIVTNDETNLYVKYTTIDRFEFTEMHLYVGELINLPVNPSGNVVPGHFPYKMEFDNSVYEYTFVIPIKNLPDCFIIAAHSVVTFSGESEEMSAWSFGTEFPEASHWGWYSDYCMQFCK